MQSRPGELTRDTAEYLLSLDFEDVDRRRMKELAEASASGTLTPDTQAELDSYLHIGNLLAVMQSRARAAL